MYFLVIGDKIIVLENFNETLILMNSQNKENNSGVCHLENFFIWFLLFLLVMVFVVTSTNKIKYFIENRNINLLNIQPESDSFD